MFSEVREYLTPRAYNLLTDPGETYNILFPHTWVRRRRGGNWKSTGGHWRHTHPFGRESPIRTNQAGDEMMVASD